MTYVLVILAFFAAVAGFINVTGAFAYWLEPEEHFAGLNLAVAGSSTVVVLLGIGLGYWIYRPRALPMGVDDPLRSLGPVFTTLNAKYWVDEIYSFLFIQPFKRLANFLACTFDPGIIDGAVNGVARAIGWCSAQLRQIQTGYVRNYALSVLLGVVVIVAYFALR